MKSDKFILNFLCLIFVSCLFNFSVISQNNPKVILEAINNGQEEVILYDDKSWEYVTVETSKNLLKTFTDTSSIFTDRWSDAIFPYKDKYPPD